MWQRKQKSLLLTQAGEGGAWHLSDADHQTRGTQQSPETLSLQDTPETEFYKNTNVAGHFFTGDFFCRLTQTEKQNPPGFLVTAQKESISGKYTAGACLATYAIFFPEKAMSFHFKLSHSNNRKEGD